MQKKSSTGRLVIKKRPTHQVGPAGVHQGPEFPTAYTKTAQLDHRSAVGWIDPDSEENESGAEKRIGFL